MSGVGPDCTVIGCRPVALTVCTVCNILKGKLKGHLTAPLPAISSCLERINRWWLRLQREEIRRASCFTPPSFELALFLKLSTTSQGSSSVELLSCHRDGLVVVMWPDFGGGGRGGGHLWAETRVTIATSYMTILWSRDNIYLHDNWATLPAEKRLVFGFIDNIQI